MKCWTPVIVGRTNNKSSTSGDLAWNQHNQRSKSQGRGAGLGA
ncbi:unnamed protein product, partial [Cuscuta campestris]